MRRRRRNHQLAQSSIPGHNEHYTIAEVCQEKKQFLQAIYRVLTHILPSEAEERYELIKSRKKYLFNLFRRVQFKGGFIEVTGRCQWGEIEPLKYSDTRSDYEKFHLYHLELFIRAVEITVPLGDIKPTFLHEIPVIYPPKNGRITEEMWEEWMRMDIVILRGFWKYVWKLNDKLFSIETLMDMHGEQTVDSLVQDPQITPFQLLKLNRRSVQLKELLNAMNAELQGRDNHNSFIFGVNIDIGTWKAQVDEIKSKLPRKILWCSDDDALAYTRQHVLGMTLPQVYCKVSGCWTGGHQENLRFTAININHGPQESEWWAMSPRHSDDFRLKVLKDYLYDIYINEPLWWPDENYCMAHEFDIYHGIQKPGDLVLVGCGSPHWVKSRGVAVNTAWNFSAKNYNIFKNAFDRDKVNSKLLFRSLIPMKTLALDLMNYELGTLDRDLVEFLMGEIEAGFQKEEKQLNGKNMHINQDHLILQCEYCYTELFWLYHVCSSCEKRRLEDDEQLCFFCKKCAETHVESCKDAHIRQFIKFAMQDYKIFKDRVHNKLAGKPCGEMQNELDNALSSEKDNLMGIYESPYKGVDNCTVFNAREVYDDMVSDGILERKDVPDFDEESKNEDSNAPPKKKIKVESINRLSMKCVEAVKQEHVRFKDDMKGLPPIKKREKRRSTN